MEAHHPAEPDASPKLEMHSDVAVVITIRDEFHGSHMTHRDAQH